MTQCIFIDEFCTQNRQYLPESKNIRASYHLPIAYHGGSVKEISLNGHPDEKCYAIHERTLL
ncbi:hypothetical protein KHC33_15450 [Methanospirillum sp. J.3.6.1-F.2.7.3]|uniref:Uncharacterized protein n=1 Tax=Methanospirillum purgamenti TaxID=2834276 RepID=A0A8E7EH79_9EURY|nr:hypothetical protein [Methanospirillum sp. J.3.6.1-F.2.7.3]QVV88692.1 hypothetical protein KHC33_15450 [Methanospirillum sp. J.3.6.1-F.2.7.3]